MFSALDNIIFPDSCEVIEIVPSQQYVYPIFKNGSSSLHLTQASLGWRSINNQDIQSINLPITVYLRQPRDRFISGINTFVQQCMRDNNNNLDVDTILYLAGKHLFLNRHFAPQFYWLINLARYSSAPLHFQDMRALSQIVDVRSRAKVEPPTKEFLDKLKSFPWQQLELYFFLDQILTDRIGQTVTFDQIMQEIKSNHSSLYDLIFQKTKNIANVLP